MKNNKAILLLSGGLDSIVSLAICKENYDITKALHFNYGQIPAEKELKAFENICNYYNINGQVIDLPWLKELSEKVETSSTDNKYWIPNRNALFVNIGACYADKLNCNCVILGANKTEADTFKDNSYAFFEATNNMLKTSTQNNVQIIAPLINMNKIEIIQKAIELKTPLELIWSCYYNEKKHCGKCPSCLLLKNALDKIDTNLQKLLF